MKKKTDNNDTEIFDDAENKENEVEAIDTECKRGRGRPTGSKNKLTSPVKSKLINLINTNFDKYRRSLLRLDDDKFVAAFTKLLPLVIPRPLNDEESQGFKSGALLMKRLFGIPEDSTVNDTSY
jgi:hypothetical protein